MRSLSFLTSFLVAVPTLLAATTGEWTLVQNGTTGITALEVILVSPTLILMMDRVLGDPLQIDGHQAWVELWNLETNTGFALNAITDTFCASGALLSNGTMVCEECLLVKFSLMIGVQVSVGGQAPELPPNTVYPPDGDGRQGLRLFGPCDSPDGIGEGCTLFEDPATLHLAVNRWYPSSLRIFDGSLVRKVSFVLIGSVCIEDV